MNKLIDVISKAKLLSHEPIAEENVNEEIAQIEAHTRSQIYYFKSKKLDRFTTKKDLHLICKTVKLFLDSCINIVCWI